MTMPLRRHESKKTVLYLLYISCMKWSFVVFVVAFVFLFLFLFLCLIRPLCTYLKVKCV